MSILFYTIFTALEAVIEGLDCLIDTSEFVPTELALMKMSVWCAESHRILARRVEPPAD
mgnify:CR=1 FL=1